MKNSLENSSNNRTPIVSIPYYDNSSKVVKRLLQKYEIKIVFRINSKFDRFITLSKDPYEIGEHNNLVYIKFRIIVESVTLVKQNAL